VQRRHPQRRSIAMYSTRRPILWPESCSEVHDVGPTAFDVPMSSAPISVCACRFPRSASFVYEVRAFPVLNFSTFVNTGY
jgi:hypothetical protein